jgi:hypothetical protein
MTPLVVKRLYHTHCIIPGICALQATAVPSLPWDRQALVGRGDV